MSCATGGEGLPASKERIQLLVFIRAQNGFQAEMHSGPILGDFVGLTRVKVNAENFCLIVYEAAQASLL